MNQPLNEYLRNKEARRNTPWRYIGETKQGGYLIEDGVLASDDHLNKLYPLGEKVTLWDFNPKGDNPDKKRVI